MYDIHACTETEADDSNRVTMVSGILSMSDNKCYGGFCSMLYENLTLTSAAVTDPSNKSEIDFCLYYEF